MLTFKSFIAEGMSHEFNSDRNFVGHGDNAREFFENLIAPVHVYHPPKSVAEGVRLALVEHEGEHALKFHPNAHNYLEQEKDPGGNAIHHIKAGAEAAFPESEEKAETTKKHKEAIKHWNDFKREYENSENGRRAIANEVIDKHNAKAEEHNKTADKKNKIGVMKRKKILSLGGGTELMSSNGKYDPEKHVGEHAHGKKVKILGLALAPHKVAGGLNVCPKATAGCKASCLALHAGMNQGEERNYHLKVARTQFLTKHPEHAVRMLAGEIERHETGAKRKGYEPAVRLNANSDLNLEHILPQKYWDKFGKGGKHEVKHYDYTKVAGRMNSPAKKENLAKKGYHLTLSHTGTGHSESNDKEVSKHLDTGGNVAMVFRMRKTGVLPHTVVVHHPNGKSVAHQVHNANERDDRYNDEIHHPGGSNSKFEKFLEANPHIHRGHGKVSGLTYKGNTNEDMKNTEFAVDSHDGFAHINGHETDEHHK
jgi:hypothetical protein